MKIIDQRTASLDQLPVSNIKFGTVVECNNAIYQLSEMVEASARTVRLVRLVHLDTGRSTNVSFDTLVTPLYNAYLTIPQGK